MSVLLSLLLCTHLMPAEEMSGKTKYAVPEQSSFPCQSWFRQEPGAVHLRSPPLSFQTSCPPPARWLHPPRESQTSPGCSPPAWWPKESGQRFSYKTHCALVLHHVKLLYLITETHQVPLPVIESRAACCADQHVLLADLHQRDAVFQGKNKPVFSVFGVPIEDDAFWVKCPQLKGGLNAAEKKKYNTAEQS